MRDSKLIIVDGFSGSGKSTTAELISLHLQRSGIKARDILEDHRPNPVRMGDPFFFNSVDAWISEKIKRWEIFAAQLESSSEIAVLHGQLFHETVDSLLYFGTPERTIREVIDQILSIIHKIHPILIYLYQTNLRKFIRKTFDDRGPQWTNMQINWKVHNRPYGQQNGLQGFDGFVKLYSECRNLATQIFETLDIEKLKIDVDKREWSAYTHRVLKFLSERLQQQLAFDLNWDHCTNYDGDVGILRNSDTGNLHDLSTLVNIGRDLRIRDNTRLSDLQGLSMLESIGGDLQIAQNDRLKTLDGLKNLQVIKGELQIVNNKDLRDLLGLEEFSKIDLLRIIGNLGLKNLRGLHNVERISRSIIIDGNANLSSLEGLESLEQVGEDFLIGGRTGNASLKTLSGLQSLSRIGGNFDIQKNNALRSLNGPNLMSRITGRLFVEENENLIDLGNLSAIVSIGRRLRIANNPKLKSIEGLSGLQSIGAAIEIIGNPSLVSLKGLDQIQTVGKHITISECPGLPETEIALFFDRMGRKRQPCK